MIKARRFARICLVFASIIAAALICSPRTLAQQQLPLFAAVFPDDQSGANPSSASPQTDVPNQNGQDQKIQSRNQAEGAQKKNDRMFYVMPNYLTVGNEAHVEPLTWKGKFKITASGCFDPYEFFTAGVVAGIRQAENAYPGFDQGFAGYARRYGTAFADQVDGNMMVGAVFPSILRTDPRYYQKGTGGFSHRLGYALSRVFVTRTDSGRSTFNLSEPLGNGVAVAIGNFYYPASDRGASSSLHGWGLQMAIDGFGNVLKEFWPDIHHRIERGRHHPDPSSPSATP